MHGDSTRVVRALHWQVGKGPPFFFANFCLFCKKGEFSVLTAQPFLLLCSCPSSFYYAGNPYLSMFGHGAKIIAPSVSAPSPHSHLDHHVFPPPPLAPEGGGVPGHSGQWSGKLYLAGVAARAAAARRKEDRTNVLLARTNKTQLHPIMKVATNIAAIRSHRVTHLP